MHVPDSSGRPAKYEMFPYFGGASTVRENPEPTPAKPAFVSTEYPTKRSTSIFIFSSTSSSLSLSLPRPQHRPLPLLHQVFATSASVSLLLLNVCPLWLMGIHCNTKHAGHEHMFLTELYDFIHKKSHLCWHPTLIVQRWPTAFQREWPVRVGQHRCQSCRMGCACPDRGSTSLNWRTHKTCEIGHSTSSVSCGPVWARKSD